MFIICGYDFCRDENALNPSPLRNVSYDSVMLKNGIFSHWYITHDVDSPYSSIEPTTWDYLTVMDANFNGTLQAGNIGYLIDNIDGLRIKRRKVGEYDWITLKYIDIESLEESLSFTINDYLNQNNVEYEYAFVPVSQGTEGNYISNTINSKFDGVFICDFDTIYKFYAGVKYGAGQRVQKIGVFEPLGRKYPVVVSNALLNYETGSFEGYVINNDFLETRILDDKVMIEERKRLLDFLTNKKAKVLKDWNGNYWLMIITGNPSINYANGSGMRLASVGAEWTEVGDGQNGHDLYEAGILMEAQ